jgi:hypothetical protein
MTTAHDGAVISADPALDGELIDDNHSDSQRPRQVAS